MKQYKFSLFNIYLKLDDCVGIYNTLHDSAIAIEEHTLKNLKKSESKIDTETLSSLLSNRIIFPEGFNERAYFQYYLNKMKYSPRHASFVISLTSDCNLQCDYCFEGKIKPSVYMSPEIALKVIEFISNMYDKNSSLRELYIAFFGGEPLLNRKIMRMICEKISQNSHIRPAVKFTLTSNLTLLDATDIRVIKNYDFINVQVALDGSKTYHDTRRKYRSGKGSFDITIRNIKKLLDNDITTMIFLNFDKANKDSYEDLIGFIKETLAFEKIVFVLNPISKSLCNANCNFKFMNDKQEAEIFLEIYKKLKDNGLTVQAFGMKDMLCILTSDVSCIIDPEGVIYKCGMMLGRPEYKVGTVFSDLYENFNYEMILEEPWNECLRNGCPYLPICGGGCRSLSLINTGDLRSIYCQSKNYYEKVYPLILRDHFDDLLKGGSAL